MKTKINAILVFVLALAMTTVAMAQTKVTGTLQCGKADPQHMIEIGDRTNHSLGMEQVKCTWPKPMEIAGLQTKDGMSTSSDDIHGNTVTNTGYHVSLMSNGDKFFCRYHGTATMKEGAPQSAQGTWTITGGTGKLKGIKGKGTYKGTASADGGMTYESEGEYEVPKK